MSVKLNGLSHVNSGKAVTRNTEIIGLLVKMELRTVQQLQCKIITRHFSGSQKCT